MPLGIELRADEFEGEALPWSSCGGQLVMSNDRNEPRSLQLRQVQRQAYLLVQVRETQREYRTSLKR